MKPVEPLQLLVPEWPSPPGVRAIISTRGGGCSTGVYASANLADHVGDAPAAVAINRELLERQTGVRNWSWLKQVHGTEMIRLGSGAPGCGQVGDGVYTSVPGQACAVLTADCLPVLLCDRRGSQVAAVHAGWRGLAAGILARAVGCFDGPPRDLLAYLGPAIGPAHFEVGPEVYQAYEALFTELTAAPDWRDCFRRSHRPQHFFADLYGLARKILQQAGVGDVYGGRYCTYSDKGYSDKGYSDKGYSDNGYPDTGGSDSSSNGGSDGGSDGGSVRGSDAERFFSYRRDGVTGRMVTAVWLTNLPSRG